MGRVGRGAEAGVVFWLLETGCCCCCWTDFVTVPSRCEAGILCIVPCCCNVDGDDCCVVCGVTGFSCANCSCCLCGIRFWRCWMTVAVAFAFATALRLASSRICLAADCPSASSPWSDGRFVPSFTTPVTAWDFAGGKAENRRARCSIFFLCSISSAVPDCWIGAFGRGWLTLPAESLFLWYNYAVVRTYLPQGFIQTITSTTSCVILTNF